MASMDHDILRSLTHQLYDVVAKLEDMFPGRPFTPDGHMVGSLGEVLVADEYELALQSPSNQGFDAVSRDGKCVEIKATQGSRVEFRSCPAFAIVTRIHKDGSFEEIYNGPGKLIWDTIADKPMPSNGQRQLSVSKLRMLNEAIHERDRIGH